MKLVDNNEKISNFSYIRKQTRKESKDRVPVSSFPPVMNKSMLAGFNTHDYVQGGFRQIGVDQIVTYSSPVTAIGASRDKDKIFPINLENLEEISV